MASSILYTDLIASLPSSERLFLAKQPPISRLKLDSRLKKLSETDKSSLHEIQSVLNWDCLDMAQNDAMIVKHAKKVFQGLTSETLKSVMQERLELRTCITALRLRKHQTTAPSDINWGFGRWVEHINQHFKAPYFNLEGVFPWLKNAKQLLDNNDVLASERFILEIAFKQLQRYASLHHFDFEAVVIYVLKWNIIERSTQANVEVAKNRFNELVEQGLGDFNEPIFEDAT